VALLDSDLYFPDGQIRDEVYEYGLFLQSRMHQAGVSCSDCHDPHSLKLRVTSLRSNRTIRMLARSSIAADESAALRDMRTVPVNHRILKSYAMGVVLPFLPLLLLKYPLAELAAMMLKRLSGLQVRPFRQSARCYQRNVAPIIGPFVVKSSRLPPLNW